MIVAQETPEASPKAYSYTRFSTPEQAKGDSSSRQALAAREWAQRNTVELDEELSFRDEGVSAYLGANAATGALGLFLQEVKVGNVAPGSWLLVESLDRISRQTARKAVRTMEDIVEAGVTVVDLSDGGREYSAESLDGEPMLFMMMMVRFMRANEESALKATRVAGAFQRKREQFARPGALDKPFTRALPAWITWNDSSKTYELVPERAQLVHKMFEFADGGWGQHKIAQWLNANTEGPWGAGKSKALRWHRTYVRKILSSAAAVGTFIPHLATKDPLTRKRVRKPLEAIHHRFPPAVERELFDRVSSRMGTTAARGQHANKAPRSIFAGILKCAHCGGTVTRVSKSKHVYLVCAAANAKTGKCKYETVPYQEAEDALQSNIAHTIQMAPRGKGTAEIEAEIEELYVGVALLALEVDELLNLSISDKSRAALKRLREREAELDKAEEGVRALRERRDTIASANVIRKLAMVKAALEHLPLNVTEANAALRQAISKMVMFPAQGRLMIYWGHDEEPQETALHTRRVDWNAKQAWDLRHETAEG